MYQCTLLYTIRCEFTFCYQKFDPRYPDTNQSDHETMFYPNWKIVRYPKKYTVRLVLHKTSQGGLSDAIFHLLTILSLKFQSLFKHIHFGIFCTFCNTTNSIRDLSVWLNKLCPQIKQDTRRRRPSQSGRNVNPYKVMILSNLRTQFISTVKNLPNEITNTFNLQFENIYLNLI